MAKSLLSIQEHLFNISFSELTLLYTWNYFLDTKPINNWFIIIIYIYSYLKYNFTFTTLQYHCGIFYRPTEIYIFIMPFIISGCNIRFARLHLLHQFFGLPQHFSCFLLTVKFIPPCTTSVRCSRPECRYVYAMCCVQNNWTQHLLLKPLSIWAPVPRILTKHLVFWLGSMTSIHVGLTMHVSYPRWAMSMVAMLLSDPWKLKANTCASSRIAIPLIHHTLYDMAHVFGISTVNE